MGIASLFSKNLFWDVDESTLDKDRHARFIVERVLMRGKMEDWRMLLQVYEMDKIRSEALKIRFLDKVTLSFCSTVFGVPKSKFRCYRQPQSIQQLWPY